MYPITELTRLATLHLEPDEARHWISLLTVDGFVLSPGDGDQRIGRLGGEPELPADVDWPTWGGHGPLSFVAAIDCAATAKRITEYAWPAEGTLLFFYFDGQADNYASWVSGSTPRECPGSRILHVPSDAVTAPRATPEPLKPYPVTPVVAVPAAMTPHEWDVEIDNRNPRLKALNDAVEQIKVGAFEVPHQIGGPARHIHNDVNVEAAMAALGWEWDDYDEDDDDDDPVVGPDDEDDDPITGPDDDPDVLAEAERWKLLLQVSSDWDQGLMWGDAGNLYWQIKPDDLAALRLDDAYFTWQSH